MSLFRFPNLVISQVLYQVQPQSISSLLYLILLTYENLQLQVHEVHFDIDILKQALPSQNVQFSLD